MKIVIIGTGNVATVLGRKFKAAGHIIVQLYGRNKEAAIGLSKELGATAVIDKAAITQDAELYLIAISDSALTEAHKNLQLTDQLVVHTAGSVPMNVLKNSSSNYGVFYPFQTIRKEVEPIPEIPLLVDANNETSKQQLITLGRTISSNVSEADDTQRIQYHLCAIIVNNFSNYFYAVAENYCNAHGLDFKNLLPLIEETANRLRQFSPRQVQTGPAIRNDVVTIQKHLELLNDNPPLKDLYSLLTKNILHFKWHQP
jgi:predicted short-subunit dehydrogenase-like oxidoreductase (DUF2520 family)